MSFSKVNPSGWSVGAKLTSAQINQLDSDHSLALDKTGDTLPGVITTSGSGSIHTGTVGGVLVQVAGGIQTSAPGGIQLNGGSTDWIAFSSARTRTIKQPLVYPGLASGWSVAGAGYPDLSGPATNVPQFFYLTQLHNGATLSSVKCFVIVKGPHANVPLNFPEFQVYRRLISAGQSDSASNNLSTAGGYFTAASGSAWDNSNQMQSATATCNQFNVIDTSQYIYFIQVVDENGANSVSGNIYVGFELGYTAISDMRFA